MLALTIKDPIWSISIRSRDANAYMVYTHTNRTHALPHVAGLLASCITMTVMVYYKDFYIEYTFSGLP